MSHRRQRRRADKARRQLEPNHRSVPEVAQSPAAAPPRVVIRQASHVQRLAYTRSQAAQALGISRSTLRRLLPYIETIEMPWGASLIPVDELERLAAERRRTARPRLEQAVCGRKPSVQPDVAKRIHEERAAGKSLRQIASGLDADRIPTARGGTRWWPSTVRAILQSRTPSTPARDGGASLS